MHRGFIIIIKLSIICLLFSCVESCIPTKKIISQNLIKYTPNDIAKDSSLVVSLMKIDSIVVSKKRGRVYYANPKLVEEIILKSGNGYLRKMNFIGVQFSLNDWVSWHKWFKTVFR